jgi:hypothetical protein
LIEEEEEEIIFYHCSDLKENFEDMFVSLEYLYELLVLKLNSSQLVNIFDDLLLVWMSSLKMFLVWDKHSD